MDSEEAIGSCFLCCGSVCCMGFVCAADIAAAFVAYEKPIHNYCSYERSSTLLDPNTFLKIGALGSMGAVLMILIAICAVILPQRSRSQLNDPDSYDQVSLRKVSSIACLINSYLIFNCGWAVVGFIIFGQLSQSCKDNNVAHMILAWCVLKFFGGLCGLIANLFA